MHRPTRSARALLAAALLAPTCAPAFNPPEDRADGVTLRIDAPATAGPAGAVVAVAVTIENDREEPVDGILRLETTPEWILEGAAARTVAVDAGAARTETFVFELGRDLVGGLYPVHAHAEIRPRSGGHDPTSSTLLLHAVALVSCHVPVRVDRGGRLLSLAGILDGDAEAALFTFGQRASRPAHTDFDALVGTLYDEEALHVFVRVWDDRVACRDTTSPDLKDCDYVRVYVSPDPAPRDADTPLRTSDVVVVATPVGPGGRPQVRAPVYEGCAPPTVDIGSVVRVRSHIESDGYRMYVALPWLVLGDAGAPGAELGFKIIVGDTDEAVRESELVLGAREGAYWRDAGAMEVLRLAGETESAGVESSWHEGCPDAPQPGPVRGETPPSRAPTEKGVPAADVLDAARRVLADPGADTAGVAWRVEPGEGPPFAVAVAAGDLGLADGWIAFAFEDGRELAIGGVLVALESGGIGVGDGPRPAGPPSVEVFANATTVRLPLTDAGGATALVWTVRPLAEGVDIAVRSEDGRIVDTWLGAADRDATHVAAGMGNYIEEPGAFLLHGDGHQLATRFVCVGYEGGVDLVSAVDTPPRNFRFDPDTRTATLHAEGETRWTLVPSVDGPFAAALRYRELTRSVRAAPSVAALKGRFVLDLWGGRVAAVLPQLERSVAYGLGNAVVVWHNWQRWGYDYRLPDITPPNPDIGSAEEFRDLIRFCADHDILLAPHDNYIDIYPDCAEFDYDLVGFHADGQPMKAWYNRGRDAQSYFFRPDAIAPFVDRNLGWIRDNMAPNAYFVDVFSSKMPHGWYERGGAYHSAPETRDLWGACFDRIRATLDGAPQISESGHDQLVGRLDGAQCNHLRVDARFPEWAWPIACRRSVRIPWSDLVWHDRFVLHGAGYSSRYPGGLDPVDHGIDSDDYIATEILTGHPGMSDRPFGRETIRHFWLTDTFARGVGLERVRSAAFEGKDIFRQTVTYANGAVVRVNRDPARDWVTPERHRLPPYGFVASGHDWTSAVVRISGVVAECASWPDGRVYVNARGTDPDPRFPVWIRAESLRTEGDPAALELDVVARVERALLPGYRPFVHVDPMSADPNRDTIAFQLHVGEIEPSETWSREVVLTARGRIPPDTAPGTYRVFVGLSNPDAMDRLWVRDSPYGGRRVVVAEIDVVHALDGRAVLADARIAGEGAPRADTPLVRARLVRHNPKRRLLEFGPDIRTDGGFLLDPRADGTVRITPLPGEEAFTLELGPTYLPGRDATDLSARTVAIDGATTGTLAVERTNAGGCRLQIPANTFAIEIRAR